MPYSRLKASYVSATLPEFGINCYAMRYVCRRKWHVEIIFVNQPLSLEIRNDALGLWRQSKTGPLCAEPDLKIQLLVRDGTLLVTKSSQQMITAITGEK